MLNLTKIINIISVEVKTNILYVEIACSRAWAWRENDQRPKQKLVRHHTFLRWMHIIASNLITVCQVQTKPDKNDSADWSDCAFKPLSVAYSDEQ